MQGNNELTRNSDEWQKTFDSTRSAIWVLDREQRVVRSNKTAEMYFHLPNEQRIGRHCWEIVHGTRQPIPECPALRAKKSLNREDMELRLGEKWFEVIVDPKVDDNGDYSGAVHIVSDITKRKRAEEEVISANRFLDRVLEMSTFAMWISNADGTIIRTNDALRKAINLTDEDILGKYNVFKDMNLEIQGVMPLVRKVFTEHQPVRFSIPWKPSLAGGVAFTAGRDIYIDVSMFPILNGRDELENAVCQWLDITLHKQAQEALRESRERFQSLFENSLDAILLTIPDGRIISANPAACMMFGYSEEEFSRVGRGGILDPSDPRLPAALAERSRTGRFRGRLTFVRKDGSRFPGDISSVIFQDINGLDRTSMIIRDISEHELAEQQHETTLHQVLMNLCTNAAQAMEDAGGTLRLSVRDTGISSKDCAGGLAAGRYVEIKVSDTGNGIAPEIVDLIFDPHFTTKAPGQGSGMGLAVARGVIESYKGSITVESRVGRGSTFSIYLPSTGKHQAGANLDAVPLPTGKERILFVDDEPSITRMGSRTLEGLGYSVTTCTNSLHALELFRTSPGDFDLVITDMTMPDLTGDRLSVELLKIRPDIPVILCTGYSKKISEETAGEIGIRAFAHKPIIKSDLAVTVRKVLDETRPGNVPR